MTFPNPALSARVGIGLLAVTMLFASPVWGQVVSGSPIMQGDGAPGGRTAETGVGEVGQRQTIREAAPNVQPAGRINNRIDNRVENRIDSRIDRTENDQADTTSSFEIAEMLSRQATDASER